MKDFKIQRCRSYEVKGNDWSHENTCAQMLLGSCTDVAGRGHSLPVTISLAASLVYHTVYTQSTRAKGWEQIPPQLEELSAKYNKYTLNTVA